MVNLFGILCPEPFFLIGHPQFRKMAPDTDSNRVTVNLESMSFFDTHYTVSLCLFCQPKGCHMELFPPFLIHRKGTRCYDVFHQFTQTSRKNARMQYNDNPQIRDKLFWRFQALFFESKWADPDTCTWDFIIQCCQVLWSKMCEISENL